MTTRMGVNRSTVLHLARPLVEAGLIEQRQAVTRSGVGRPSLVISPRPERAHVLAFDAGPDRLTAARVGLGGRLLERWDAGLPAGGSREQASELLARMSRQLQQSAPAVSRCVGVGAALADDRTWVAGALQRLFPRQVTVGRRIPLAGLAERERGAGAGSDTVAYLHGGRHVDGGVVLDGSIAGRHDGTFLGHLPVDPRHGQPCPCGARGCLDTKLSSDALFATAGRAFAGEPSEAVRALTEAAAAGERGATRAVAEAADWLGIAIAGIAAVVLPEVVVLDGTLRELYAGAAPQVHDRVAHHVPPAMSSRITVLPGVLGRDAALVGAAELSFAIFLEDPLPLPR